MTTGNSIERHAEASRLSRVTFGWLRRAGRRIAHLALMAGIAGLCAACGASNGEQTEAAKITRWIEVEPHETLTIDALYELSPSFSDDFARAETLTHWRSPWSVRRLRATDAGLPLKLGGKPANLERTAAFAASDVQLLDLEVHGLNRHGSATLYWRRTGDEAYSEPNSLKIRVQKAVRKGKKQLIFRFDLRSQQQWQGQIESLRLMVVAPESRCRLVSFDGHRLKRRDEQLASAVDRPILVDLDSEVRPALVSPPGSRLERRFDVPDGGRLLFGMALQPGIRHPVQFHVAAVHGGTESTVFSRTLDPAQGEVGLWIDAAADLSAFAGSAVNLVLSTAADADVTAEGGVPLWSGPILTPTGLDKPPIILISVDTLRADRLGLYGNESAITPNIDAWAREHGVVFKNAVAQAPWTLPSHVSMLTGLEAFVHGINYDHQQADNDLLMLAERLREQGYVTAAFTGGGLLHPRFGFAQGFDTYYYWPARGFDGELDEVSRRAFAWIDRHADVPFFLFLHTYEVHAPFLPRQPWFESLRMTVQGDIDDETRRRQAGPVHSKLETHPTAADGFIGSNQKFFWYSPDRNGEPVGDDEMPVVRAMYDSSVARVDAMFGDLRAKLSEHHIANDLTILTSDHGEALGENGRGGHGYFYENNLMVPLVVSLPDRRHSGSSIEQQVRSIDIVPTVLAALGLDPAEVDGRSLLGLLEGLDTTFPAEAFSYSATYNFGLALRLDNRLKFIDNNIPWKQSFDQQFLFDLDTDPEQLESIDDEQSSAALSSRMRELITPRLSGLSLTLRNASENHWSGVLHETSITAISVKSWDVTCPCVTWSQPGMLEFEVPPGQSYTLYLDRWQNGDLLLKLAAGDREHSQTVTSEEVHAGWGVTTSDGGWLVTSDDSMVETGLYASYTSFRERPLLEPAMEAELRSQLEALGYLQ